MRRLGKKSENMRASLNRLHGTMLAVTEGTFPNIHQRRATEADIEEFADKTGSEMQSLVKVPLAPKYGCLSRAAYRCKGKEYMTKIESHKSCKADKHSGQLAYEELLLECQAGSMSWRELPLAWWASVLYPTVKKDVAPVVTVNLDFTECHLIVHNLAGRCLLAVPLAFRPSEKMLIPKTSIKEFSRLFVTHPDALQCVTVEPREFSVGGSHRQVVIT